MQKRCKAIVRHPSLAQDATFKICSSLQTVHGGGSLVLEAARGSCKEIVGYGPAEGVVMIQ